MSRVTEAGVERFLDQHEAGYRAEDPEQCEQSAAFSSPHDRGDDPEHTVDEEQDSHDHGVRRQRFVRRNNEEYPHSDGDHAEQDQQPPHGLQQVERFIGFR